MVWSVSREWVPLPRLLLLLHRSLSVFTPSILLRHSTQLLRNLRAENTQQWQCYNTIAINNSLWTCQPSLDMKTAPEHQVISPSTLRNISPWLHLISRSRPPTCQTEETLNLPTVWNHLHVPWVLVKMNPWWWHRMTASLMTTLTPVSPVIQPRNGWWTISEDNHLHHPFLPGCHILTLSMWPTLPTGLRCWRGVVRWPAMCLEQCHQCQWSNPRPRVTTIITITNSINKHRILTITSFLKTAFITPVNKLSQPQQQNKTSQNWNWSQVTTFFTNREPRRSPRILPALTSGNSSCPCFKVQPVVQTISSGLTERGESSSLWTARQSPSCGVFTRTSQTWTMKPWGELWDTIIREEYWPRWMARDLCISLLTSPLLAASQRSNVECQELWSPCKMCFIIITSAVCYFQMCEAIY